MTKRVTNFGTHQTVSDRISQHDMCLGIVKNQPWCCQVIPTPQVSKTSGRGFESSRSCQSIQARKSPWSQHPGAFSFGRHGPICNKCVTKARKVGQNQRGHPFPNGPFSQDFDQINIGRLGWAHVYPCSRTCTRRIRAGSHTNGGHRIRNRSRCRTSSAAGAAAARRPHRSLHS